MIPNARRHGRACPGHPRLCALSHGREASATTSRPRSPIPTARRISGTPMRRLRPTPSRAFSGSTATTSISSPAPTSTASRCCRRRTAKASRRRELLERNVPRFQAMVERLNCSNDDFIRTTEARHHRSSQAIWERMAANGDIYLSKYSGWYSVRDEAYYDEDETRSAEGRSAARPAGHAGRMGRGGELFLQALRLPGQAARPLCAGARLRAAEGALQ